MNPKPTGAVMTPWGFAPVFARACPCCSAASGMPCRSVRRKRPLWTTPPTFAGNAHQRRVKRRAYERGAQ